MADELVKTTIYLDKKIYEKLRKASYQHHMTNAAIIRKALAELFLTKDLEEFFKDVEEKEEKSK